MEFLDPFRGGAGLFRDQLDGGNSGPAILINPRDVQRVFRFDRGDGHLERFGRTFQKLNRFHKCLHNFHMMRAIVAKKHCGRYGVFTPYTD